MVNAYRNHLFKLDVLVNKHWNLSSIPSTHINAEQVLNAYNPIISEMGHEDRKFIGELAWPTWLSSGPVRNPDTKKKWKGPEE